MPRWESLLSKRQNCNGSEEGDGGGGGGDGDGGGGDGGGKHVGVDIIMISFCLSVFEELER